MKFHNCFDISKKRVNPVAEVKEFCGIQPAYPEVFKESKWLVNQKLC
jgi:hypothetical protein